MYTFSDIQDEVKRRSTRDQGGTQFDTGIKRAINASLFRIAREGLWRVLRRESTVAITASVEEFNLPPQVTHRFFLWHEDYGYPYLMRYIPEGKFIAQNIDRDETGTPTHYRMWTVDMVQTQPSSASVISISSSSSADTSIDVTVFGIVSGFPDYETISTDASDGTTASAGSKSFTSIDRIVKAASTTGRITATSNSGAVTVATLPTGDTTGGIVYHKIKLFPQSNSSFNMNVYYYKDPYRLVNSGDIHELGQDFDEAIILLATSKLKFEQNQSEGKEYFSLYTDELKSLKKNNIDKIDWIPKLQKPHEGQGMDFLVHPHLKYRQAGASFGPRTY